MSASSVVESRRPAGMTGFFIVWAGQFVSVLASNMTQFALTIWAFEKTGSATALGAVSGIFFLPLLLLSPFAGVMVDRYNRKLMMMLSDLLAVVATFAILILNATGQLQMWHLYVASLLNGIGNCFQWPAYSAAISTMLPKEKYRRANGMMSLMEDGAGVIAPMLAGVLLPFIQMQGILIIDVVTFFIAIGALLLVVVPQPQRTLDGQAGRGNIFREAAYGFQYIFARPGLLSLLIFFLLLNFSAGMGVNLLAPFILTRTGNNTLVFGSVQSAWMLGAVFGSLLISLGFGFKRRTTDIFISKIITPAAGIIAFGFFQTQWGWIATAILGALFMPVSTSASQAIWQSKVAPDVQGRVFTARRTIATAMNPITPVIAGLLADHVMEPAMAAGGGFAAFFGPLVGTTPGSGMAVQFILAGSLCILINLFFFFFVPRMRNVETELPDHDQLKKVGEAAS